MTVKDEIGEMIKSLSDVSVAPEPEPEPEPIPEPAPEPKPEKAEEPKAEPEPEPEEKAEEKAEEPKVEEKAPEPKPTPEPDERDRTISELRAKLEEATKVKVPEKPEPPKPPDEQDFLGELDLDELTRDPKEFNKVLNKIYQKAVIDTRSSVVETLPDIVKTNIQIMNELKATSDNFYEENKDLRPFKKVVAVVFDELVASNPNRTYSEIIKDVAPEVRKRLELKKEVKEENGKKPEPPKLPQKAGRVGRSSKPTLEPLQSELEEMNKILGR